MTKLYRLKRITFIIVSLILIIISIAPFYGNNFSKNYEENSEIKSSSDFKWINPPTLSNKYFSPYTTPGNGDNVIYTFSINETRQFNLSISAYYDTIDNYPGSSFGEATSSSYLLENGTWLIVGIQTNLSYPNIENYLIMGIGSNPHNFEWKLVGEINETSFIDIAGNESGSIQIVYGEETGLYRDFKGIKYFESTDWGESWINGTIANYTGMSDLYFHGISITEFNGNFTTMWSIDNTTREEAYMCFSQKVLDNEWRDPANLTALDGFSTYAPQLVHNRTEDNGTLYVGCNLYIGSNPNQIIFELGNGINGLFTDSWLIPHNFNYIDNDPLVYFTKDYNSEVFYFLDRTADYNGRGIKNATWKEPLSESDIFQTESDSSFRIHAMDGPLCFSGHTLSDSGFYYPGILNCSEPFNVVKINDTVNFNEYYSYIFNGKDENGYTPGAEAYSFNIKIGETEAGQGEFNKIVFVDDTPSIVNPSFGFDHISPFSSPGVNDYFNINITANKPGSMTFNVKSEESIIGESIISDDNDRIDDIRLCGDGVNYYMFYNELEGGSVTNPDVIKLMFTKSADGGITWNEPKMIETLNSLVEKRVECSEAQILLWTREDLYISSDSGYSFQKYNLDPKDKYIPIVEVSDDLKCWRGGEGGGVNTYQLNVSNDHGFNWESFSSFTLTNAANYSLSGAAYDPLSSNYSLLLDNTHKRELLLIVMNHNGSNVIISEDIAKGFYPGGGSSGSGIGKNYGCIDLDVRNFNATLNEWIIFSSLQNFTQYPNWYENYTSNLYYRTTLNGINFSSWNYFTNITGDILPAYLWRNSWDIYFPEDGDPCYATGLHPDPNLFQADVIPTYINTYSKSSFVFGTSKNLDSQNQGDISYYGITSNGEKLPDGNYTWDLSIVDESGYISEFSDTITIDNSIPILNSHTNLTCPKNPIPNNTVTITVPLNEINPDTALLYYRTTGDWNIIQMNKLEYGINDVNYTAQIPSQGEALEVFWKVIINDTCGNILELDNDGKLYSYARSIFEYVKAEEALNPTLYDNWTWNYIFTSGEDYVDDVWINMIFDGSKEYNTPVPKYGDNNYSMNIQYNDSHSDAVYKFMFNSTDGTVFEIASKALETPSIRIEREIEPPSVIDLMEQKKLKISFTIPEYSEYVSRVYIFYKYDVNNAFRSEDLIKSGSSYIYTFESFPIDATKLNYTVIAVDIYGSSYSLDNYQLVQILPELPTWQMSSSDQIIIVGISLSVGAVSGVGFSFLMNRKAPEREIYHTLSKMEEKKIKKGDIKNGD